MQKTKNADGDTVYRLKSDSAVTVILSGKLTIPASSMDKIEELIEGTLDGMGKRFDYRLEASLKICLLPQTGELCVVGSVKDGRATKAYVTDPKTRKFEHALWHAISDARWALDSLINGR